MSYMELFGWAAAATTFASHSMKTMLPLRLAAICANLLFITYGGLTGALPVLVLHVALLPLNGFRLVQILRTTRQVRAASPAAGLPAGLVNLLSPVTVDDDAVIFRRGDPADRIYFLRSGRVLLEEIGAEMQAGELFGEVAFFSESRTRTLTARCIGRCELAAMSEAEFTRFYYQHPEFAFFMLRLLARRLEARSRPAGDPGGAKQGGAGPDGSVEDEG